MAQERDEQRSRSSIAIGNNQPRRSRGRTHPEGASFPVPPPRAELPADYAETLAEIKTRIRQSLRTIMAANSADRAVVQEPLAQIPRTRRTRGERCQRGRVRDQRA